MARVGTARPPLISSKWKDCTGLKSLAPVTEESKVLIGAQVSQGGECMLWDQSEFLLTVYVGQCRNHIRQPIVQNQSFWLETVLEHFIGYDRSSPGREASFQAMLFWGIQSATTCVIY